MEISVPRSQHSQHRQLPAVAVTVRNRGLVLLLQPFPLRFSFRVRSAQACRLLVAMTRVCVCVSCTLSSLETGFPTEAPASPVSTPLSPGVRDSKPHTAFDLGSGI